MTDTTQCPLCNATGGLLFFIDKRREYLRCTQCGLVFVPSAFYLSVDAERAEYDKHENHVADPGYRQFLARLFVPLGAALAPGSSGLDFGCGPGPALAAMFRESGHKMALYDPFYAPDKRALIGPYDFVCATEVVEHLHRPGDELARLWGILVAGGTLGIMTKLVRSRAAFASWHYKNDPTHVCFFSRETWLWWAQEVGAQLRFHASDVILLSKPVKPRTASVSRSAPACRNKFPRSRGRN